LIAIRQKYDNLIKGALVKIGAHEGLSIPGANPEFSRAVALTNYLRASNERPSENAFCLVAPTVLFKDFAILPAGVFFFAKLFKSRTSLAVHSRLVALLAITSPSS
jgi:hypothetical protein